MYVQLGYCYNINTEKEYLKNKSDHILAEREGLLPLGSKELYVSHNYDMNPT